MAHALQTLVPSWIRSCQDVLGSRQAVESHILRNLSAGKNVIVDRTNVTVDQRSNWLRVAKQWQDEATRQPQLAFSSDSTDGPGCLGTIAAPSREVEVDCFFLQTSIPECTKRLQRRTVHETLHSPEQALMILRSFANQLQMPRVEEGFNKVLILSDEDAIAGVTVEEQSEVAQRILDRLEAVPNALAGGTRGPLLGSGTSAGSGRIASSRGRGGPYGSNGRGWGALDRGRGRGGPRPPARGGYQRDPSSGSPYQVNDRSQATLHQHWSANGNSGAATGHHSLPPPPLASISRVWQPRPRPQGSSTPSQPASFPGVGQQLSFSNTQPPPT